MRRIDCGSACVGPDCEGCGNFKPLSSDTVLGEVRELDYLFERLKHEAGKGQFLNIEYEMANEAWQKLRKHFA